MKKKIICIVTAVLVCVSVVLVSNQTKTKAEIVVTSEQDVSTTKSTTEVTTQETTTKETTTKVVTQKAQTLSHTEKKTTKKHESVKCKLNNFKTEGNISQVDINESVNAINRLPESLINKCNSEGWKMILTSYDIAKNYYDEKTNGKIGALTWYDCKTVYISNKDSYPNIRDNVYHEFGHVMDDVLGKPSQTANFELIWKNERNDLRVSGASTRQMNHARATAMEYYAASFASYMQNCNQCKENIPDTYNCISECLNSL